MSAKSGGCTRFEPVVVVCGQAGMLLLLVLLLAASPLGACLPPPPLLSLCVGTGLMIQARTLSDPTHELPSRFFFAPAPLAHQLIIGSSSFIFVATRPHARAGDFLA